MPKISKKEGGATRTIASVPMAAAMQPYAGSQFCLRFSRPLLLGQSLSSVDILFCEFVSVVGIAFPCRVSRLGIPALQIYVFYFIQQSICRNLLPLLSLPSSMGCVACGFLPVVALPCRIREVWACIRKRLIAWGLTIAVGLDVQRVGVPKRSFTRLSQPFQRT